MSFIRSLSRLIPDKMYLRMMYYKHFRKLPNLKNPKTFNEKLQWLKLNDRRPEYTQMVDKYEAKKYVAGILGEGYIIPTIGVWNRADDIPWDTMPDQFVLKCNNDSGGVVVCEKKESIDIERTKEFLNNRLKNNGFWYGREWPYKHVTPCIIAEQYLSDESGQLVDYKIHCFNGEPKIILVCRDRYKKTGMTEDFYTVEWKHLDIARPGHRNSSVAISCPKEIPVMIELSKKLSKNIPFLRVDFYVVNGHVYIGELTFYPASGFQQFEPQTADIEFGKMLNLTE